MSTDTLCFGVMQNNSRKQNHCPVCYKLQSNHDQKYFINIRFPFKFATIPKKVTSVNWRYARTKYLHITHRSSSHCLRYHHQFLQTTFPNKASSTEPDTVMDRRLLPNNIYFLLHKTSEIQVAGGGTITDKFKTSSPVGRGFGPD